MMYQYAYLATGLLILIIITISKGQGDAVELISSGKSVGLKQILIPFEHPFSYPVVLQPQGPIYRASAQLVGDNAESGPGGQIIFRQWASSDPVVVSINVTGLPVGKHAVHVHAFGDLKDGCKSTGPHFQSVLIGNIDIKEGGSLDITFHSPYLVMFGPKGIVGRSIVIHEKPIEYNRFPDIYGLPSTPIINGNLYQSEEMNVGAIIACGIITITDNQVAKPTPPPQ